MPSYARAALAILPLLAIGAAPPERVIRVGSLVSGTVGGLPARLLADPGAPSMVMVSGEMAMRAQLRPGPFAMAWLIGPVRVPGRTAVVRVDLGSGPEKKRIGWSERPYIAGVDGAVGPGGLKEDVVRFVLRDGQPGERETVLPLVDGGGIFGGAIGLFARVEIDGAPVRIRFDLRRRDTLTSAGMALTLARTNGGSLGEERRPVEVVFGVERPVRRLSLARPLAIGPLAIRTIDVRTTDYGNAEGIAATAEPDPEEVVVTAKGQRDRSRDRITVGADALERCSSITFDKRAKLVRLRCVAG